MSITPDILITSNPFIAAQCDQAGEIVMLCDETALSVPKSLSKRLKPTKVERGSSLFFTLLGVEYGFNFLTGKDYADMQAFAAKVYAAGQADTKAQPVPPASNLDQQNQQLRDQNTALDAACAVQDAEIARLRAALERLARLGNGDNYGNSLGNGIAIAALNAKDSK